MGSSSSKDNVDFSKNHTCQSLKITEADESVLSNPNHSRNLEYPAFGQSRTKINNAKFTVKLRTKIWIGVSIGISTMCHRRDAKLSEDFSREFYMIDCSNGIFSCNHFNVYLKEWPHKINKDDLIQMQLLGDVLYMSVNDKHVA